MVNCADMASTNYMKFIQLRLILLTIVLNLGIVGVLPSKAIDSSVVVRYDIAVGNSYNYDVKSDQHVVKSSAVRLQTNLAIEVVGKDSKDNFKVRLRVRGDTARNLDEKSVYRPSGSMNFSGHRLFSDAGRYHAALDALGRVILGQNVIDGPESELEVQTQFERVTDISVADVDGKTSQNMLNFTVPSLPFAAQLELAKEYFDTLYIPSRVIDMPTSGIEGKPKRQLFVDTIFRVTILDSVVVRRSNRIGYFTMQSKRNNKFGSKFTSTTTMRRNLRSGMVEDLVEHCYRITSLGPVLEYNATAKLTSITQVDNKATSPSK